MKTWILKAIVQKTISFLPYKHQINYFFQRYVTKGVLLNNTYFTDRLVHANKHLRFFEQYSHTTTPSTTLELGTGWYPVVPISLFLNGADTIYTVDISPLLNHSTMLTTIQKMVDYAHSNQLKNYITYQPQKLAQLEQLLKNPPDTLQAILDVLHIKYLIADARNLPLPNNSISLITSNNTFEHIYPNILKAILAEFKRISQKNGGIQSHFIDMSDHFAHFDQSITIYNYLQFSDAQWALIDNSIQPQNRLRLPNYLQIYQQIGLPITHQELRTDSENDLKKVPVHRQYANLSTHDLAVSHCYLISKL